MVLLYLLRTVFLINDIGISSEQVQILKVLLQATGIANCLQQSQLLAFCFYL